MGIGKWESKFSHLKETSEIIAPGLYTTARVSGKQPAEECLFRSAQGVVRKGENAEKGQS